jgi:PhnB protein
MQIQPYLFFNGRAEEAAEFYRSALGAEVVTMMRYSDSPEPQPEGCIAPGFEQKVMHMALRIGTTELLASDGMGPGPTDFKGVSLALSCDSVSDAERRFNALSDGGQVRMPLGKTFFSPAFGMVGDRFGVSWMVMAVA